MKKIRLLILTGLVLAYCGQIFSAGQSPSLRRTAREIGSGPAPASGGELYRPVDMNLDEAGLYVLDLDDNNVKVFSRKGDFLFMFGRKGQGPGEFHRPSGIDIRGKCVYVADAGNRRIQILDKRGAYLGSFKVPVSPYRVLALEEDRIVVLALPSFRSAQEKLLHCYDREGRLLWQAADSFHSGDSVYDLMRNRMFVRRTPGGELWLVPGADSRIVRRMNAAGFLLGEIKVDESYAVGEVVLKGAEGRKRTLRPFCWHCALDGETLYLLMPERMEDGDLGPGRKIAVVGRGGGVSSLFDLPVTVSRIAVEGRMVFGIDLEARLRIFELGTGR